MQSEKRIILILLLIPLMLMGLIGWMLPLGAGWLFSSKTELPNTDVQGVLTDQDGNVYCYSEYYQRIQKYQPDGKFVWGFEVDSQYRGMAFEITREGQICIIESVITADNKSIIQYRKYYDGPGKFVRSEELVRDRNSYPAPMRNIAWDVAGNQYTWKGFLFPRVIKETPGGEKRVLASTPAFLWFLQGPFPAFGFYGGSMGLIILLLKRQEAAAKPVTVIAPKGKRISIWYLLLVLGVFGLFIAHFVTGRTSYLLLFVFSIFSFFATLCIVLPLAVIYGILYQWRAIKADYPAWKASILGPTREKQEQASLILKSLDDPILRKLRIVFRIMVASIFWLWLTVQVVVIGVVLYLDYTGLAPQITQRYLF